MDPTTQAHFDPLAPHGSAGNVGTTHASGTGIGHGASLGDAISQNPALTSKQPAVHETSGLTTASVPPAPYPGSADHPGPAVNITNPFDTRSTGTGTTASSHIRTGSTTNDTVSSSRDTATDFSSSARDTTNNAAANTRDAAYTARERAADVASNARDSANNAAVNTKDAAYNAKENAKETANNAATGIRQRVRKLSVQLENAQDHPAVKNAKGAANNQLAQIREQLGRSQTVRDLEKRTGIDRVALVFGGAAAYLILIPFNLLRLALPITTLLTILPASWLSAEQLDSPKSDPSDTRVKSLLSYFVVLGFIQTIESLMAGFLERKIPQYYTIKLLFLAYLLHPRTQGALKVHESVFRPALARARQSSSSSSSYSSTSTSVRGAGTGTTGSSYSSSAGTGTGTGTYGLKSDTIQTPPTSKPSLSAVDSPIQPATAAYGYGSLPAHIPLPGEAANATINTGEARGQDYSIREFQ